MRRHSRMEFMNNFGVLISIVTASMIAGGAITGMYTIYSTGVLEPFIIIMLLPFALLPMYLFDYGKTQQWFH